MMIPFLRAASPAIPAAAGASPRGTVIRDPLDSPLWADHAKRYLGDLPVVFDERVQVMLPHVTENQTQVPITIDARALGRVDEIVGIVDLHPFPNPFRMVPTGAQAFIGYRQKIEQGTPVRAAVRQGGVWYVGGRYLDAAGGGCSVPPAVIAKIDWENVGQVRARLWREAAGLRLRTRILHPMDNGMMANIPAFFIETLDVSDAAGAPLAKLHLSEAIAADPTLTLLPDLPASGDILRIAARDNNGGLFRAAVPIPAGKAATNPFPRVREGRL